MTTPKFLPVFPVFASFPIATPSVTPRVTLPHISLLFLTFGQHNDKMGQTMSWVSNLLWAKKEIRILILGLVR